MMLGNPRRYGDALAQTSDAVRISLRSLHAQR